MLSTVDVSSWGGQIIKINRGTLITPAAQDLAESKELRLLESENVRSALNIMYIAKVINCCRNKKDTSLVGSKSIITALERRLFNPKISVAVDSIGAGIDEIVLVTEEFCTSSC